MENRSELQRSQLCKVIDGHHGPFPQKQYNHLASQSYQPKLDPQVVALFLQDEWTLTPRESPNQFKRKNRKGLLLVTSQLHTLLAASPSAEDLELCWCHHQSATATNTLREDCDFLGSDSAKRVCSQQESSETVHAVSFCLD